MDTDADGGTNQHLELITLLGRRSWACIRSFGVGPDHICTLLYLTQHFRREMGLPYTNALDSFTPSGTEGLFLLATWTKLRFTGVTLVALWQADKDVIIMGGHKNSA